jgi:hypothetical protein
MLLIPMKYPGRNGAARVGVATASVICTGRVILETMCTVCREGLSPSFVAVRVWFPATISERETGAGPRPASSSWRYAPGWVCINHKRTG